MTVQDVMAQIRQLSFEDRLQLLELLTHSMRDECRVELSGVPARTAEELEADMKSLAEKGASSLPSNFSREDIYFDHD